MTPNGIKGTKTTMLRFQCRDKQMLPASWHEAQEVQDPSSATRAVPLRVLQRNKVGKPSLCAGMCSKKLDGAVVVSANSKPVWRLGN